MKTIIKNAMVMALIAIMMKTNAQNGEGEFLLNFKGGLVVTPEIETELAAIPMLQISPDSRTTSLPSGVDNSKRPWFRDIFVQKDGCCGQAAGVGYTFTYELNRLRNLEANVEENQYPTHFTYNYLNEADTGRGSWPHHGWEVIKQLGVPSVEDYGGMFKNIGLPDRINVWETGYNHYYDALANKTVLFYERENINGSTNLDNIKHWLNDHGNAETTGGVAVFCANVFYFDSDVLPEESDSTGQWIVTSWGNDPEGLHAMTIVGYDDNIMYDFNGDGYYTNEGEITNWERGAFIVANSWGTGSWGHNLHHNNGFLYVPYRLVAGFFNRAVYCLTVTDSYSPEIVLKVKVKHPSRRHLLFYADYATNSSQTGLMKKPYIALNWNKYNCPNFENLSMQGLQNNNDPIEMGLDYGQLFKEQLDNNEIGKVFFIVREQADAAGIYDGEISDLSLLDYRWNEVFELPYQGNTVEPLNNNDYTQLGINYHLLPFEEAITSGLTMVTDRVARRTVTVNSGTFTINSGVKLDMYGTDDYDCNLVLSSGTNFVIGDNAIITAKRGNCLIDISGEIQIGDNVRFVAENGATLLVRVNHGRILHLDNCSFENASLLVEATKGLKESLNSSYIPEISVENCRFTASYGESEFAIKVYGYIDVLIKDNIICGLDGHNIKHYADGIIIHNSGNLANNSRVYGNSISGCIGNGLALYAGRVDVLRNRITKCGNGVCMMNNSTVNYFDGNCAALNANQTQYIHDNDNNEVVFCRGSVPREFRFNYITNSTENVPFVCYDNNYSRGLLIRLDLEYNNWGNLSNSAIENHFSAVNMGTCGVCFDYSPQWNLGACLDDYEEASLMEREGDSLWGAGAFASAKQTYKNIIELYPASFNSSNAMKKLFLVECASGQDFSSLQEYYGTNNVILGDENMIKLSSVLSNKCNEEMKKYDEVIAWYENVISDTSTSHNDSICATIDLGGVYLTIAEEGGKAMGKLKEFVPQSAEAYSKQTNLALHQLRFDGIKLIPEKDEQGIGGRDDVFNLYPNPTKDAVKVIGESIESLEIVNLTGQQIIQKQFHGLNEIYLNLEGLSPGVYFVRVSDSDGGCYVKKLVKE